MGTCKFPSLHPCFPHLCLFLASQSLPLKTQGKEARREELAEKRFISFPEYIIANRFSAKGCVNPINDVCEGGFPVSSLRPPQGSLLAPLSRNKSTGTAFMMADQDDFRVKQGSWNDDIRELSICVLSSILLRDWFNQIKKIIFSITFVASSHADNFVFCLHKWYFFANTCLNAWNKCGPTSHRSFKDHCV